MVFKLNHCCRPHISIYNTLISFCSNDAKKQLTRTDSVINEFAHCRSWVQDLVGTVHFLPSF